MLNIKPTALIALSLMLLNTNANAGFFDNLADNLKSGNLEGLITDAVTDVAKEVAKGAQEQKNTGSEKEEVRQSNSFNNVVKKPESVESKPVATNLSTRVIDRDDLLIHGCLFCSQNERIKLRYKDEKKPFSGIGITKYANGSIKVKEYLSDGIITLQENFYESGQLSNKLPMTYNEKEYKYVRHGEVQTWHDNGQLKKHFVVDNGEGNGLFKSWHENGQLALERTQNKKCNSVGSFREWYKNGNPKIKQTYSSECKAEGLSQEWHENGQLKNEETLKAGVPDGVATYWHENGILKQKLTWTNGYTDQFFTEYYDNGNKKIEQKKVGNYFSKKMYFENGNFKHTRFSTPDQRYHQFQIDWYENGEMMNEDFYFEGVLKKTTKWDEDGSITKSDDHGFRYSMIVDYGQEAQ